MHSVIELQHTDPSTCQQQTGFCISMAILSLKLICVWECKNIKCPQILNLYVAKFYNDYCWKRRDLKYVSWRCLDTHSTIKTTNGNAKVGLSFQHLTFILPVWVFKFYRMVSEGARSGTVGWGTALQAGRSQVWFPMVSLGFFIDLILLATLWPWGWLSL